MRSKSVLPALLLFGTGGLLAQGVVNPSLLRAPETTAAPVVGAAETVAKVRQSVVYVCVEIDGPRGRFPIERASSGVVVDASGLVLTWKHLVEEFVGADDKTLLVQLDDAGNTRLQAAIERIDDATGLALLRVDPPAGGLQALTLGADRPSSGEPVVVLARPEGKDMLAFAGIVSPALAATQHRGVTWQPQDLFLSDARNDERCDGAAVVDTDGRLLGLYGSDNVQRDRVEPTLEDLKRPSFGVVVSMGVVRRVFADEFGQAKVENASLRTAPVEVAGEHAAAVSAVAPAMVSVWAGTGDWPALGVRDPGAVQRRDGLGSGVVLTASGLVVTNRHLVEDAAIRVRRGAEEVYPARVVKQHGATNLALLQVELPAGVKLSPPTFAVDEDPILGETVLAIGNPLGTGIVASAGVVSAIRGRAGGRIQADANLGNANAGGAIIDLTGRVIGIGDGGAIDPIEMAFVMRGDSATTETNLSTFVGIRTVRRIFADEIAAGVADGASIRVPGVVTAAERAVRQNPLTVMVEKASAAMLNIYIAENVAKVDPDDPFASMVEPELRTLGLGSGVIIDRSGLALSNWHVVDAATNPDGSMRDDHAVTARVFGGRTYDVRVLSISREDDLSLLQLELRPGEEVQAVELGDSDALRIGQFVAAIGNPHGRANTITFGVVSAKGQSLRVKGRWARLEHLIETDAAINGGNSGGALLDMQGLLVGINSAGGGTFNNKGYAIAVDHVRATVLGKLLAAYKLRSPNLGLRVLDDEGKVLVMDVDDRGPAAPAGVRGGDRVVSLAGVGISWSPGFALQLLEQQPGKACELVVERDGKQRTMMLTPIAAPVWSVVRQSDLLCRICGFREDPDRVRAASMALHRQLTGDPRAEPNAFPEFVVAVDKVFAAQASAPIEVEVGDLLLAVELRHEVTGNPVFIRLASIEQIRDLFNDRTMGKEDGVDHYKTPAEYAFWIARGREVKKVRVFARRLLW